MRRCLCPLVVLLAGCAGDAARVVATREANLSRAAGPQVEAAIAIDPRHPDVLLAGSNSPDEPTIRVYASADGGATWRSDLGPLPPAGFEGGAGDPVVAIGPNGRQYAGFLARRQGTSDLSDIGLFVASRPGAASDWQVARADAQAGIGNDKPAIAIDERSGRVYVAWTRFYGQRRLPVEVASSGDGGRTWSVPVAVHEAGPELFASIAVAPDGAVYVVWDEFFAGRIGIARSEDGGRTFGPDMEVAGYEEGIWGTTDCEPYGVPIPAQREDCVRPNPIVTAGAEGVYVTWAAAGANGSQDVFVRAFEAGLRPRGDARAIRPDDERPSDQFWPTSAYDRSAATLWACFYDTRGADAPARARFTCTASRNGGDSWLEPVGAARVASDETRPGARRTGFGDYEGVAAAHGRAHAVWTDSRRLPLWGEEIFSSRLRLRD